MVIYNVKLKIKTFTWKITPTGCAFILGQFCNLPILQLVFGDIGSHYLFLRLLQRLNEIDIKCLVHGKFQIIALRNKSKCGRGDGFPSLRRKEVEYQQPRGNLVFSPTCGLVPGFPLLCTPPATSHPQDPTEDSSFSPLSLPPLKLWEFGRCNEDPAFSSS